jgi:hypothetical protein
MARIWEKYLTDTIPDKKRLWAILSAVFDVCLIGLLILVLVNRSCEICYSTNGIQGYVQQCKSVTDIYATGHPLADRIGVTEPVNQSYYVEDKWQNILSPDK